MLKSAKNIKKNAFFLTKVWFFEVLGIILHLYDIFIKCEEVRNSMEGGVFVVV